MRVCYNPNYPVTPIHISLSSLVRRSVNDAFVMKAWGNSLQANDVTLLADWDGSFTKAIGMDLDLSAASLGKRSKRYSLIVKDGVIVNENVETSPAE